MQLALSLLLLPLACNYPSLRRLWRMTEQTSHNIISKALDFAAGESVYFAFQGGEPLIAGLPYFENFVKVTRELNIRHSVVYFSLQTNGTLVTDEWAKFFKNNNFLIGLSLDGNQNANKFRVDNGLNYTFPQVFACAQLFQRYDVDFNILTVTTGYTAEHITEIYNFFKQNNFRHLQFIPCLRPFGDTQENELFMTPSQYSTFLITLFNLYVKDYVRGDYTSVRMLDNMVNLYLGKAPEQCGVCGHCSHQFVFEGNGNAYPCDFYCSDEWLLGNVNNVDFEALARCDKATAFIKESFDIPTKCLQCNLLGICRAGGCKRSRQDRDYCQSYTTFFNACLPLFTVFNNEKLN
ncbi:MAG: SPASM domain-containing protein [Clostridia bacterium]